MKQSLHMDYIRELRKGSHDAFNTLYDMYADSLYGFVLLHTKSEIQAEDIVQETFLKIWSIKESISLEGSFKSMLFTIAKNRIIDAFRQQINKPTFEDYIQYCENEQLIDNSLEETINYDDFKEKLDLTKRLLTDSQRTIFELSREKGLSNEEISFQLQINEQTVKNHLSAALKILRAELSKFSFIYSLFI